VRDFTEAIQLEVIEVHDARVPGGCVRIGKAFEVAKLRGDHATREEHAIDLGGRLVHIADGRLQIDDERVEVVGVKDHLHVVVALVRSRPARGEEDLRGKAADGLLDRGVRRAAVADAGKPVRVRGAGDAEEGAGGGVRVPGAEAREAEDAARVVRSVTADEEVIAVRCARDVGPRRVRREHARCRVDRVDRHVVRRVTKRTRLGRREADLHANFKVVHVSAGCERERRSRDAGRSDNAAGGRAGAVDLEARAGREVVDHPADFLFEAIDKGGLVDLAALHGEVVNRPRLEVLGDGHREGLELRARHALHRGVKRSGRRVAAALRNAALHRDVLGAFGEVLAAFHVREHGALSKEALVHSRLRKQNANNWVEI